MTLNYIDGLPEELKSEFLKDVDDYYFEVVQHMIAGLKKVRQNILPSEQELGAICRELDMY